MFAQVCSRKYDGKTFCVKIKTEAFFLFFTVIDIQCDFLLICRTITNLEIETCIQYAMEFIVLCRISTFPK